MCSRQRWGKKTLNANLFNSTIFACDFICKQNIGYPTKVRLMSYRKIHAGLIVRWAHGSKWRMWLQDTERKSFAGPDTLQGTHKTDRPVQLSSGVQETRNNHLQDPQ